MQCSLLRKEAGEYSTYKQQEKQQTTLCPETESIPV